FISADAERHQRRTHRVGDHRHHRRTRAGVARRTHRRDRIVARRVMLRELLLLAMRNMRRQPRRTILTALTFAVAVFLYTVLVAVPVSMDRIEAEAAKGLRLITIAHNSYRLPAKDCNEIRKMPHVVACAPEIQFTTVYRDPRTFITTFGVTEDIYT